MEPRNAILGVDIGTSSTKGVLVDPGTGEVLASASIAHEVERPQPGWVEMDGRVWWEEFVGVTGMLLDHADGVEVIAVGVSGMGPCVLLIDEDDEPVRPAILYGVDVRAVDQIERMSTEIGNDEIARLGGSRLTTQAAGPKIAWIADNEPEAFHRGRRIFMPASWLVRRLAGAYVLDHQSASQCTPLYNIGEGRWHDGLWARYAAHLEQPRLAWPGEVIGTVTTGAALATGIPVGVPVIAGTIDAWTEAVSVGACNTGDLMVMYGSTMFLVATLPEPMRTPSMWTTTGAFPETYSLAGGLATSGALTAWIRDMTRTDFPTLLADAACSGVGAGGLLMLPYFAGERTPIMDPDARGVIAGLTLDHRRGDLYRAALEGTAFGVRHNIESMRAAGADIQRMVAVGGGTQGDLWMQVVSDVTGLEQEVPRTTIGASYGAAYLAACAVSQGSTPRIDDWNPVTRTIRPDPDTRPVYDLLYTEYLDLYLRTRSTVHELAGLQRDRSLERTPL